MRTNTSTTRIQVFLHQNTVFHQLLQPILRQDFERLAKQYHQGQKLRSATRWDQFIAILMSKLSCRQSLRGIESNLELQQEKLYHLGAKRIARNTLARINQEQPARLYQELFIQLLQHCENSKIAHKFRFKNPLYSLDASHIDLSLSLCEWAKVHESKASIKLTVGLNHSNTIPEFVALGDGIENDMVQGRTLKFPPESIVVFDKGYVDYQWFAEMTNQNFNFVTRLRPKTVYEMKSKQDVLASTQKRNRHLVGREYVPDRLRLKATQHPICRQEPQISWLDPSLFTYQPYPQCR